jgi:hypothetical protein
MSETSIRTVDRFKSRGSKEPTGERFHPDALPLCGSSLSRGARLANAARANLGGKSATPRHRPSMPVLCVDTGRRYESMDEAAKQIGFHRCYGYNALRSGGLIKGMRFVYG